MAVVVNAGCDGGMEHVVRGSRDDVRTRPGSYKGYRVVDDCGRYAEFGVIGLGEQWYGGVMPGDDGRTEALRGLLETVEGDVRDIGSWEYGGVGSGCTSGPVPYVAFSDWRDVDLAIMRLGLMLRQLNLAEEVAIIICAGVVPS